MVRMSFFHLRETTNIGDRWCSPYDHIDWSRDDRVQASAHHLTQQSAAYDIGVFGGGKILRDIGKSPAWQPKFNIGWGISTVQSNPLSIGYFMAKRRLNLIGSRDWDGQAGVGGCTWVPCASSEHAFFNAPPPPRHSVVVYAHKMKSKSLLNNVPSDVPVQDNHHGNLLDALQFISSGEVVVSNSYHGVFWALLMGRKVLCAPFSGKFNNYRLRPGYTEEAQWQRNLHLAQSQPEILPLCRAATAGFRRNVDTVMDQIALRA